MRFEAHALQDEQLQEILLGGATALPEVETVAVAEAHQAYASTPHTRDRCLIHLLDCAGELARRRALRAMLREALSSPQQAKAYFQLHFRGYEAEAFAVMFLDATHRVLAVDELFRGTLTQTSVYPREVVKRALQHNAGAVMLAHNHPSGLAEPSRADEYLTQTLKTALGLIDVRVLDHLVVGATTVTSLAEHGLL